MHLIMNFHVNDNSVDGMFKEFVQKLTRLEKICLLKVSVLMEFLVERSKCFTNGIKSLEQKYM